MSFSLPEDIGMAEQPTAYLVIRQDRGYGNVFPLTPGEIHLLGRATSNHIVLRDDLCSREHAEVHAHDGQWRIRDLNSLNGTRVNNQTLDSEWELAPGDEVNLGGTTLLFVEDPVQLPPVPVSSVGRMGIHLRPRTPLMLDEVISIRLERWGLREGPFGDELARACDLADGDPDMALTKSRKILEGCLYALHKQRIGPPGTRRLEQLIVDLGRAGVLPRKMLALCEVVRELGNVGAHPIYDGEDLSHREAQLAVLTLTLILEWYVRRRECEAPTIQAPLCDPQSGKRPAGEAKTTKESPGSSPG
jgi:hypothetical protein